jgi:hypothetical protein
MTPTAITTTLCPAWVFPPTSAESSTPVRPHLLERLGDGLSEGSKLTLISALQALDTLRLAYEYHEFIAICFPASNDYGSGLFHFLLRFPIAHNSTYPALLR